ncbi:vitamin K epoxide reductase family protein [Aquimarina pacifica]|uniref:vitamin K epoxide reductase family protein n=1 Tax=Aquimarina pacifica TaxID=1296415 RepID=UPI00046EE5CA|nr:vitamin K epoxide reductase family protein [Aquimarina pacifica]
MNTSIEKIVESVLIQNRVNGYDKKDLELQLQIHPNYPSFQSITDTLDYFNIDNIAVEVPVEALDQLPKSFISLIKSENTEEIVSVIKNDNTIELKHIERKKKKYTFEEFTEIWNPKVIAVESGTKQTLSFDQSWIQGILIIALLAGLATLFFTRTWDLYQLVFFCLSIFGSVFSLMALRESLGIQSKVTHQFCTTVGNTNCGDVINNNSGKLFKNFTLADAGIVFFGSLVCYQVLYGFTNILCIPVFLGIPVVLYSLYSQALIIKKWCAICLFMGSVSIGLAIIAFRLFSFTIPLMSIAYFLVLGSIFTLLYLFIKEKIVDNKKLKSENLKLNQFKRDENIFNHLLSTSEKIKDTQPIENEIVLGNPNAPIQIISLTNPMCGYCKDAFAAYARVYKSMGDQLQIRIRLSVRSNDLESQATQIALRLFEIYENSGTETFVDAYTNWFEDRTYSTWIKKYSPPKNNNTHLEILKKQTQWLENNALTYTPATLINDTLYPKKYDYKEFFHFINILLESNQK